MVGPPLGGAAVGLFGPVTTMLADAVGCLLGHRNRRDRREGAAPGCEPGRPVHPASQPGPTTKGRGPATCPKGGRFILTHPALRPVFFNTLSVNGLILAVEPLIAVLMLGRLGFAPWRSGLAFAAPCVGGLISTRLSRRLVARLPGGTRSCSLRGAADAPALTAWLRPPRPGRAAGLQQPCRCGPGSLHQGMFGPVFGPLLPAATRPRADGSSAR